jgi:hypothetical protein
MKISIAVLAVLIGLYFLNSSSQKQYTSSSSDLFTGNVDDIHKILIQKGDDILELAKFDTVWTITGHDTLEIKERSMSSLLDRVLTVKKENIVTKKQEKWDVYSITDSMGTHLGLIDKAGETLAYFVFGQSKTDYSHNYVRTRENTNVYLTSENVIYNLQTRPQYWGEKPKEEIPEPEEINSEE